jgi:hypothetical protein
MRSLVERRWKRYVERVASGEITAENYVYRPRGPMRVNTRSKVHQRAEVKIHQLKGAMG